MKLPTNMVVTISEGKTIMSHQSKKIIRITESIKIAWKECELVTFVAKNLKG